MSSPAALPRRVPFGLADAVTLLAAALAAWWFVAPAPAARRAADDEHAAVALLDAIAAAAARVRAASPGAPVDLDALASADPSLGRRLAPTEVPGVRSAGAHWFAVLVPSREDTPVLPRDGDPSRARRGWLVLAWPRPEAPRTLRALAARPDGILWQRGGASGHGAPAGDPPLPRTAFPEEGPGGPEPVPVPPDWVVMRKRRGATGGGGE